MRDLSAYVIGRAPGSWPGSATPGTDMLFAAIRKDGQTLEGVEFEHCTFANVSFKDVRISQCRFTDCAFLSCYFRKCEMAGSSFLGCTFAGCDFPKVKVQSCDFKYSRFLSCAIPFAEMEHSLPREPNLREDLTRELAMASDTVGRDADGRRYRLAAIQAREEHLIAAIKGSSDWYQRHYSGARKAKALVGLLASKANGLLWGHGERWWPLIRNLLVLALLVFPIGLWITRDGLRDQSQVPEVGDLIWLSLSTIIPVGGAVSVEATAWDARALLTLEAFVGVVAGGLFVTQLVRRMLKR